MLFRSRGLPLPKMACLTAREYETLRIQPVVIGTGRGDSSVGVKKYHEPKFCIRALASMREGPCLPASEMCLFQLCRYCTSVPPYIRTNHGFLGELRIGHSHVLIGSDFRVWFQINGE